MTHSEVPQKKTRMEKLPGVVNNICCRMKYFKYQSDIFHTVVQSKISIKNTVFKNGVDLSTLNADRPLRLAHHQWSLLVTAYGFLLVRRSSGTGGQSFNYIVSKTSQQ